MFNKERTLEVFGYTIDSTIRRRTKVEFEATGQVNKKDLLVVDNCPSCGNERTIKYRASSKNKKCYKCHHNSPEMIETKKNQNKEKSEETKQRMRENHWSKNGGVSAFKGKKHTKNTKKILSTATQQWYKNASNEEIVERSIKASCSVRGIAIEDFDGWATEEGLRQRGLPEYKEFEKACLLRDKTCQYPTCMEKRSSKLTVHHKDGFHWAIERRHDVQNGVTLCHKHHNEFHTIYKKRNNTEKQFIEWINNANFLYKKDVKLIILAGVSGSGKSWIASHLDNNIAYVPYDKTPKEQHLLKIIEASKNFPEKPILYDPFRKGGSILNRYSKIWDVKLVVIDESLEVIESRLLGRGGSINKDKVIRAIKNNRSLIEKATFSGTSSEVLEYLKNICN